MSARTTSLILFIFVSSLLLFSYGMAHTSAQSVNPFSQEKGDKESYASSAVEMAWNFENYTFSFALPEAMEGYFYPNPFMIHSVIFPLGPQKIADF